MKRVRCRGVAEACKGFPVTRREPARAPPRKPARDVKNLPTGPQKTPGVPASPRIILNASRVLASPPPHFAEPSVSPEGSNGGWRGSKLNKHVEGTGKEGDERDDP